MRIGVNGSWREEDRTSWGLAGDFTSFKEACHQLGAAIAQTGAAITVGSDRDSTADKYVVEGYLSHHAPAAAIKVVRPRTGSVPFADLQKRHPQSFLCVWGSSSHWRFTRQEFVSDVDALVTIGGADGTYQAALELRLTRKRLVPIGTFGGASGRVLTELLKSGTLRDKSGFERLSNLWTPDLAAHVVDVLGASRPSKVLLIHGHAQDWVELETWLKQQKLADPVVMGQEFTAGQTLPEKFEELADEADAAIALATPDDRVFATSQTDDKIRRARQNVWVEVGWFWGRLGRHRVMLLVRGDVEIPSDLDGIEFQRYQSSALELAPKIEGFLLEVGKRNQ